MTEPSSPALSPSERATLAAIANGDSDVPIDWLAQQRLRKWGLLEERDGRPGITAAGRAKLRQLAGPPG